MSWAGPVQIEIGKTKYKDTPAFSPSMMPQVQEDLPSLVCFSHLRWNFVYQRPQHLMSRFARDYRVFFVEEPVDTESQTAWLDVRTEEGGVRVVVPRLPGRRTPEQTADTLRTLLDGFFATEGIVDPVLWYYTPMSLDFTDHLRGGVTVYDCMDELSAFKGAPPQLIERERTLLSKANLVFTGGYSLWEAKRSLHANAHPFPSSVDVAHFAQARATQPDPEDQAAIPHPRLGFYGVIDERFDIDLIDRIAEMRPDLHFVLVGPVVKIDPETLPKRPNIHYLGPKVYDELPHYLSGWDVALLPFALNESTRFISPTKTPEYLAGGCPAVSTPIKDVVRTYGDTGVVRIARTPEEFIAAIDAALEDAKDRDRLLATADAVLRDMSWDKTWNEMKEKIECAL
ncbi:glycosyltransferase family 1 protein (plasmid) [Skermanella rosea]|uniref:glycosyltransferase family 1 protein n=1 Tax=Skermanella rosea TaxID=1817965 RepID=UPI001933A356|nr:glycosyltransferase family 1 protein [Skermanella rosea]UEM06982.1 glycosyltransferase family 1 protein [Skermanella rosea]